MLDPEALPRLRDLARETLVELTGNVCEEAGIDVSHVYEVALAGNATMTALVLGIDPEAPEWARSDDEPSYRALSVLVDRLVAERQTAREQRDWASADRIRTDLAAAARTGPAAGGRAGTKPQVADEITGPDLPRPGGAVNRGARAPARAEGCSGRG